MKKHILIAPMLAIAATTVASAQVASDVWTFEVNDEQALTATVTGLEEAAGTVVAIPETAVIDGKTYTVSAVNLYWYNTTEGPAAAVERVVVPKTVTEIEYLTCSPSVASFAVEFAEGSRLATIGRAAFSHNAAMRSIELPPTVTEIGMDAFNQCGLERIAVPEGVTRIENSTFNRCPLVEAVLPDGVTYIGNSAFCQCPLASFDFPEELESIGSYAFEQAQLAEVVLPSKVSSVGEFAFADCPITKLQLSDSLKVLRRGAFARTQIKEVVIPEGVETLEADVFSRCPLEKIFFLPTGVVDMSLSFSSPFPYMYDATVYLPEGAADSDLYSSWTSYFGTVELLSDEEMGVMLGIGGVAADGQRPGAPCYTLGGVKVGEPLRPGLYISRGKKVLVK